MKAVGVGADQPIRPWPRPDAHALQPGARHFLEEHGDLVARVHLDVLEGNVGPPDNPNGGPLRAPTEHHERISRQVARQRGWLGPIPVGADTQRRGRHGAIDCETAGVGHDRSVPEDDPEHGGRRAAWRANGVEVGRGAIRGQRFEANGARLGHHLGDPHLRKRQLQEVEREAGEGDALGIGHAERMSAVRLAKVEMSAGERELHVAQIGEMDVAIALPRRQEVVAPGLQRDAGDAAAADVVDRRLKQGAGVEVGPIWLHVGLGDTEREQVAAQIQLLGRRGRSPGQDRHADDDSRRHARHYLRPFRLPTRPFSPPVMPSCTPVPIAPSASHAIGTQR